MKYALIGCGRVSKNHIKAAILNNLEIIALCDIIPEKAQKLIDEFSLSNVKIFKDYKQMISETKPDFVAIATDSGKHAEIAIYCADNETNFIVEKPGHKHGQKRLLHPNKAGKGRKRHGEAVFPALIEGPEHQNGHTAPGKLGGNTRPGSSPVLQARYKANPKKRQVFFHISNSLYSETTISSTVSPITDRSLTSTSAEI